MKVKSLLIALVALLITGDLWAQKSKKEKVDYKYTQLPMEPQAEEIKSYSSSVIIGYADEEAEKEKIYTEEKKAAEKKFEDDKKEYKNKSLGKKLLEKTLLDEGKPQKDQVAKPTYKPSYNTSALAGTYLVIEGYDKGASDNIQYEVTLEGLKSTDPVIKNKSYKDKEGRLINQYYYEVIYNYPMTVRLEVGGEEILNESYEEFEKDIEYNSKYYSSYSSLKKALTPNAVMKHIDNKALKANLSFINRNINEQYGYMQKKRKTIVYAGKGKKHDYTDLTKAYISIEQGLVGYNEGEGTDKIKEAIALWNTALTEKDYENKKARISKDVAFGLFLNLIEYNVLINEYKAAKAAINEILLMNPSKSQEKKLDTYKYFYDDMSDRFDANNP